MASTCRVLVFIALLLHSSSALYIHTTNSSLFLPSVFTTISSSPKTPISANFTVVYDSDIHNCKFKNESFSQKIRGTIVVFADYLFKAYLFKACVTDEFGNAVLFQKIAQQAGAVGVVTRMSDYETNYQDGRIAGFTSYTKIPFVVLKKEHMASLVNNLDNVTHLEIPVISTKDDNTIHFINRVFHGMIIADAILFFATIILFGEMIVRDVMHYWSEFPKTKPPGISVKLVVFLSSIFEILWLLVDPGSFHQKKHFPSVFFMYMHIGMTFIVLYLLLGIWARVTTKIRPDRLLWLAPYFIYSLSIIMLIFTILIASLFYIIDVSGWYLPFRVYGIASVVICEIGYVYYGKNIVSVLCVSGNSSSAHHRLSFRIVSFILVFLVLSNIAIFVFQTGTLGGILGVLFFEFFIGLCYISICLVLLFNSRKRAIPKGPSQDIILNESPPNSA